MALSEHELTNENNEGFGLLPAFLFPGQGSQEVGMGQDLYENSPAARLIFDEADEALSIRLTKIMFEGPAAILEQTINAQPAILTTSLACLAAAKERLNDSTNSQIHFMAGHSLGEYTALVAAGVLDAADGIRLVQERGRLMQEACDQHPGTMAAILGLEEEAIEGLCRETGTQIANVNAPGQIVISGEQARITKAMELASTRGAKRAIPLKVSGAFHSYLMGSAMEGMAKALDSVQFHNPVTPIIANCNGKPMNSSSDIKEELEQQLCGCVRWKDSISYMSDAGVTNFIEFGPGHVLSGMVKRIVDKAEVISVSDFNSAQSFSSSKTG